MAHDRVRPRRLPGPAIRSSASERRSFTTHAEGRGRPVLHSGRRSLIYGIASAATCAPPGCGTRQPPFASRTAAPRATTGRVCAGIGRGRAPSRSRRVRFADRARWYRPVTWRRLNETHKSVRSRLSAFWHSRRAVGSGIAAPSRSCAAAAAAGGSAEPARRKGTQDRHRAPAAGQRARGVGAGHQRHEAARLKEAGGEAGGYTIEMPKSAILDDAKDGVHDPQTGAQNMRHIVVTRQGRSASSAH